MTTLVDETPIDTPLPKCRDTDDQKFMEVAARCRADLLVTRDKELLRLARSRARPAPFGIVVPEKTIVAIAAMTNHPPETQEIST
jgi:predicted nucleic acid-binding protein